MSGVVYTHVKMPVWLVRLRFFRTIILVPTSHLNLGAGISAKLPLSLCTIQKRNSKSFEGIYGIASMDGANPN